MIPIIKADEEHTVQPIGERGIAEPNLAAIGKKDRHAVRADAMFNSIEEAKGEASIGMFETKVAQVAKPEPTAIGAATQLTSVPPEAPESTHWRQSGRHS